MSFLARHAMGWATVLALLGHVVPAHAEAEQSLAVFPVRTALPEPGAVDIATLLTGSLTARLAELGAYRVISADEVTELLKNEAERQSVGCSDASCLAELAGALGAQRIVSGDLTRVGRDYLWSSSLVDQVSGDVLQRAQVKGGSTQVLAAQVEEVAYALLGRAGEVSLDSPGAAARLGFVNPGDFPDFKRYRAAHAERSLSEALTGFLIARNVESNRLAVAQAVVFTLGAGIPGMLGFLSLSSSLVALNLGQPLVALPMALLALALVPLGPVLIGTGVGLAVYDALDLGRVPVKASGCCRQDAEIRDALGRSGLRRALALVVFQSGALALAGAMVSAIVVGSLTGVAYQLQPYVTSYGLPTSEDAFAQSVASLGGMSYGAAAVGIVLTIPVAVVTGIALLLWPDRDVVEDAGREAR